MPTADVADVRAGGMETPEEMEKKKNFDHDGYFCPLCKGKCTYSAHLYLSKVESARPCPAGCTQ